MLVISYADFFSNPAKYQALAASNGIKILPEKSNKKISSSVQKKLDHLHAVVGLIPQEINADELLNERRQQH